MHEAAGGLIACVILAAAREAAIHWTPRLLKIHGGQWDIECELRQVEEPGS
ncbi:MAG TPA: hypothetical protein VF471_15780 [Pseudoxanthomonas sp.]